MTESTPKYRAAPDLVRLVADLRTWMAVGLFALTWHLFDMIEAKPLLTSNQGFMFLAQAVIVTAFVGSVVGFLYVASKAMADQRPPQPSPPAALAAPVAAPVAVAAEPPPGQS